MSVLDIPSISPLKCHLGLPFGKDDCAVQSLNDFMASSGSAVGSSTITPNDDASSLVSVWSFSSRDPFDLLEDSQLDSVSVTEDPASPSADDKRLCLETALIEEITESLKQCAANLAKQRDFRLARAEARLEDGNVDLFEVAHPEVIKAAACGDHHYMARGFVGGRQDDMRLNGYFYMSGSDVAAKVRVKCFDSTSTEVSTYIPLHFSGIRSKHLDPSYLLHRCHRAVHFAKTKSYREIMSRLAVTWERRRARMYFRKDPPANTPMAPSINVAMHYLSDNKTYEHSAFGKSMYNLVTEHDYSHGA